MNSQHRPIQNRHLLAPNKSGIEDDDIVTESPAKKRKTDSDGGSISSQADSQVRKNTTGTNNKPTDKNGTTDGINKLNVNGDAIVDDDKDESSDYGEDIFADQGTIATYVLPHTQQHTGPQLSYKDLNTQISTLGRDKFQTQATQIITNGKSNGMANGRGGESAENDREKSTVQVEASSPIREYETAQNSSQATFKQPPSLPPPPQPAFKPGGILANAMAPPGTVFRRPFVPPQAVEADDDVEEEEEEDPPVEPISSDDDLTSSRGDIRPSSFVKGPAAQNAQSATSTFKDITSKFTYSGASQNGKEGSTSFKRAADDMASAYGSSARRNAPAPKAKRQNVPSRAMPVQVDIELDDIPDYGLRQKVSRMSLIYSTKRIADLRDALVKKKGNYNDAINYVAEMDEREQVDLTRSDDADPAGDDGNNGGNGMALLPKIPPAPKPSTKRQVKAPNRTIQEKWSSTQAAGKSLQPAPQQQQQDYITIDTPPTKPKRRLVRGRKDPSSPAVPSPVPAATELPRRKARVSKTVTIDSDTAEESGAPDSDTEDASDSNDDGGESGELEGQLLSFLNECTLQDLADISAQPEEVARAIVDKRPFRSLDAVRAISIETATAPAGKGKAGTGGAAAAAAAKKKRGTRTKPVGDKVVDVCLEMWAGYNAVDRLVKRCEELGRPIAHEMESWGFDVFGTAKDGEMAMTALKGVATEEEKKEDGHKEKEKDGAAERLRDSGIGTPSSSSPAPPADDKHRTPKDDHDDDDGDDDDIKILTKKPPTKFLSQPACMSKDRPMKDYQLVGLNWLNLLWSKKLSCILADDMGLGKTCQVIAFLSHLHEGGARARGEKRPHLVIVPGSTLENWLREFQMFSPGLVVEPYYGLQNERAEQRWKLEENLSAINVIVTTYDTAWKPLDNKFLRHVVKPIVCVYDEGHALKNSNAKRYRELMRIPAQFRLLLTGTPLQNNLQELSSLLSFMLPDLFDSMKDDLAYIFKHKAKTTDADHSALLSAQRISRARSMMTPFILRRRKHQVLKHLPKKTCRVEYCDLHPSQANLYAEELQKGQQALLDRAAGLTNTNSANIMMALRKAAIHPLLFRRLYTNTTIRRMSRACLKEAKLRDRDADAILEDMTWMSDCELHRLCEEYPATLGRYKLRADEWMHSGKVGALAALLKRFVANGDRTLIFSQFTSVMDIFELVLDALGIHFFRLDGSTPIPTRQDMIDEFYRDASVPVFMLSTKAGGSGINLACANKVVIADSSFNPQEDVQAENRAHRVGQTREVEVVRLVSCGTIEEQIYALGESKLALDERVAGEEGAGSGAGGETGQEGDKDGVKVEKEGMEIVERMMVESLGGTKGDDKEKDEDNQKVKKKKLVVGGSGKGKGKNKGKNEGSDGMVAAASQDLKEKFLNGLKDAGVDVVA